MSDPYSVLGVSRDASDEHIKSAYRELAKKYHPDHYIDSPLSDLAAEKMKEINKAYDTIMEDRRNKANNNNSYKGYRNHHNSNYIDVRNFILSGRLIDAEQILDGVLPEYRDAEWYFLKGSIQFRKGFLDMAYNNISRACELDPSNTEYQYAFNQVNAQRNGAYGGYNASNPKDNSSCNACDACSALLCADCCCECMGGDFIPCC